jgi:hypothetical protein
MEDAFKAMEMFQLKLLEMELVSEFQAMCLLMVLYRQQIYTICILLKLRCRLVFI